MKKLLLALPVVFILILSGCDFLGTQPYTISWEDDGSGYYQFFTNETKNYNHSFFGYMDTNGSGTFYEANFKMVSGNLSDGYGLVFCSSYPAGNPSYYEIVLRPNGTYYVYKEGRGALDDGVMASGTAAPFYSGFNKINKIGAEISGGYIYVYINGAQQGSPILQGVNMLSGKRMGAVVNIGASENFPDIPVDVRFNPISY